jgi:inosose dehydratase
LTVGIYPDVPDGVGVLERVRDAGYVGIDLGPVGYLGEGEDLARNLREHGLGLTGGYLELPFHEPEGMPAALIELEALLGALDVASPVNEELGVPAPRPTIAVISQAHRRAKPGRAAKDRSLGYTDAQWATFAEQAEATAEFCRQRGFAPVFHNETGTNVEADWEIERVLELTSFDACLDTGHLIACGGDPVDFLRRHHDRVSHLHIKSAHRAAMQRLIDSDGDVEQIWSEKVFCRLGEGDLDLGSLAAVVHDVDYQGWMVVEQDIFPDAGSLPAAERDQVSNLEALRGLGF